MNLSIPCGLSTRFFTIILCLTGFALGQAQTVSDVDETPPLLQERHIHHLVVLKIHS